MHLFSGKLGLWSPDDGNYSLTRKLLFADLEERICGATAVSAILDLGLFGKILSGVHRRGHFRVCEES